MASNNTRSLERINGLGIEAMTSETQGIAPENMKRWENRVALVTGASVGIGAAVAQLLVRHGMTVIGCARDVAKIEVQLQF